MPIRAEDALQKAHDEAHGGVANEIIEVDPAVVEAFLGRVTDPPPTGSGDRAQLDSAFRAIMFTDLKDSTAMTTRLGDVKALDLLHIHNSLTDTHCVNTPGEKSGTSAMESWRRLFLSTNLWNAR